MSAVLFAILVFLLGLAATGLWFGVIQRRKQEVSIGIQSLAGMKWRQCVGLVLEALIREGYSEESRDPSSGEGNEFSLVRDGQRILASYKHGTAYQISEIDVRDFANRLSLKGAARGLLITLGNADPATKTSAVRLGVDIYDGNALWAKLQPFVPEAVQAGVTRQALAQSRKSLVVGASASLVAGLAAYFLGAMLFSSGDGKPTVGGTTAFRRAPATQATAPTHVDDMATKQLAEARKALAEIASLSDEDKTHRRAEAAKQIASIVQVQTAVWSAQSTLLLTLSQSDGKDERLIEEACRVLVGYEELRYSRLQLDPPPDSNLPVRWRQCN
jgi:hypothetical protein